MWVDSTGKAPYLSHGQLSVDGRTVTTVRAMDEPTTDEIGEPVTWTVTWNNADEYVLEAHEIIYGEPFRVMRVVYTRRRWPRTPGVAYGSASTEILV